MSELLETGEESRAFIETFVKEIVVSPGNAVVRYSIPIPDDSRIPGMDAEEAALHGSVPSTVQFGGPVRTPLRRPPGNKATCCGEGFPGALLALGSVWRAIYSAALSTPVQVATGETAAP